MFGRFMPREGAFFELFNRHASEAVAAANELIKLMANPTNAAASALVIETHEKRADKITQECIELLHKTFITPLDRDDIYKLITRMDDILDLMEDAAQSISLYDITLLTPEAGKLAQLCVECTNRVKSAVGLLSSMDNYKEIIALCNEIDALEAEADHVERAAMAKLFRNEPDVKQLIKLKAVYELLETVTDRCEDVANVIEGIVVENI